VARQRTRGVLIDLDNTLVDREGALRGWLRARGLGRRGDLEHGLGLESIARELVEDNRELGPDAVALAARIRAQLPQHIAPESAVLAALDRLAAAGLRLALVTNGGGRTQRAKLAAAGIETGRFACVLISGELGVAKPDPRIFARAARALELEAGELIMIGDSPSHDIDGAARAGLASCWIARGRRYPRGQVPPSLVAPDFPAAVERLLALA
jgi:HAD superfamily hydrolase (TIGR01509 family)